ncbi:MAG TPA: VOC family protein [Terracidiphilus sp.]|jgi:predicted enzyme related to lactoylglutathione lyase|nr:VOC family protein [Terracidiphilus sp.]HWB96966.1 VOC family protein [Bryobacteraceae bacterium]
MARVVGVGGVFLKARDPKALSAWYAEHLGIPKQDGGALAFDGPDTAGMTVFAHFPQDTRYFGEGEQQVMVNFRVDDLDGLLGKLEAAGVRIDPKREDYEYGRFAWIWDPEDNRVELWQPV